MSRPQPLRSKLAQPFWDATAEGRLVLQRCAACGRRQHYPRPFCTACLSVDLGWVPSTGLATVYSFTVIRRALNPAFRDRVPYVYALVDLDDGVRMTTNIIDVDPGDVHIGMRVEVVFEDVGDGVRVPLFRPVG